MPLGPFVTYLPPSCDPVIYTTLDRRCEDCGDSWTAKSYSQEYCPACWPVLSEGVEVATALGHRGVVGPQASATLGLEPGEAHGLIVNIVWPNGSSSYVDRRQLQPLGYIPTCWERLMV